MLCILQPNVVKLYGHYEAEAEQQTHTHTHHLPLLIVFGYCRCRCRCLIILCKHISSSFNVLNQITHVIVYLMIYFYFSNGCVSVSMWKCEHIQISEDLSLYLKTENKIKEWKERKKGSKTKREKEDFHEKSSLTRQQGFV